MKFTDRSINALKPKKQRYEVWEDGRTGFGVRVSPKGTQSWLYMYRFEGMARRMTLGTYPQMGLADANVKMAVAKRKLKEGRDPGLELVQERQAEQQAATVEDLVQEYLKRHAEPNKRSAKEDRRCLEKDVLPYWGKRKANGITRRDAIVMLDRIVDRGSPIMANRTLAVARRMFRFAVDRDVVNQNPFLGVRKPATETTRDRILTETEIKTFWHGMEDTKMPESVGLALKLLLVTVQRRSEVVQAVWSEFDLPNQLWLIGGERTKNGKPHTVALSDLAMKLLARIRELSGDSKWLFPAPRLDRSAIDPRAINHRLTENLERIGLSNLRPHDLRRTGASLMTAIGIPRLVVSKILNHADREITGVYDRHTYDPEKRHALEAWAAHLEGILSGKPKADNVVMLATAGETT
jgi:integrase